MNAITPEQATGQTQALYGAIKRAVGAVPNIYHGIGSSALALEGVLHVGELLGKGQLTHAESDDDLRAVKAAGYNDAQITEALLTVSHTVFANLFNRVHQTPLDFPAAPAL